MTIAGKVVLVLEDEPIIAMVIEDMLLEGGAEPIFASTFAEATSAIEAGGIDAAVLDVNVHGARSYPVAVQLRAAGIPFIFATGYGPALHEEEFARIPTIVKPYGLPELTAALDQAAAANA